MPLNLPAAQLPAHCDVLVVGAGPAGSACARVLAQAGLDVVLVDQQAFPRDKVCGDGLIPDTHHALQRLGLLQEVMAAAHAAQHLAVVGPRGGRVDVPGTLAVLPRKTLDHILCRAAADAGARMFAPLRFVAPLEEAIDGVTQVVGATLQHGKQQVALRAQWVVIASGALPQAMQAVGLSERRTPTAIALRGYVHNPAMTEQIRALEVIWHPAMRKGYGWIFPCGKGLFNIGVGVGHSHAKAGKNGQDGASMQDVNLREMLKTFGQVYAPAGKVMDTGTWTSEPKGAPLRCSLTGARWSRPGLIACGEAIGSTYACTGEGIGKALETGILVADTLLQGRQQAWAEARVREVYEQAVMALKPRYDVYDKANAINRFPWLVDLMVWSANRSPRRLKRMSGVLEETHLPSNPLGLGSWMRSLFMRG